MYILKLRIHRGLQRENQIWIYRGNKVAEVNRGRWADYNLFYLHFSEHRLSLLISVVNGNAYRRLMTFILNEEKVNTADTGLIECSIIGRIFKSFGLGGNVR